MIEQGEDFSLMHQEVRIALYAKAFEEEAKLPTWVRDNGLAKAENLMRQYDLIPLELCGMLTCARILGDDGLVRHRL